MRVTGETLVWGQVITAYELIVLLHLDGIDKAIHIQRVKTGFVICFVFELCETSVAQAISSDPAYPGNLTCCSFFNPRGSEGSGNDKAKARYRRMKIPIQLKSMHIQSLLTSRFNQPYPCAIL